jgi:hypothetical protein
MVGFKMLINACSLRFRCSRKWTNSGGEMVASFASEHRLATLVGLKTAGNVLGGTNFKLRGGYRLRLPVFGWYTAKGEVLEGVGISPDMEIRVDQVSLSEKVDHQMIEQRKSWSSCEPSHEIELRDQFSEGFSARSMTKISTGAFFGSSLSPSCS